MNYIALLRGINVGKERRVDMKKLKSLFESLGCTSVSTYINSGNVVFESKMKRDEMRKVIEKSLNNEFGFDIPTLVKTSTEMIKISKAIPEKWKNDTKQRTDVAYLFPEIDTPKTIADFPVNRDFINIRYTKGAIFWNIDRKNYNKSSLNKIIGHPLYQSMTLRNINTARYLSKV